MINMRTIWSDKIDGILKVGQLLDNTGISNWALTKKQALDVLEEFAASEISVLGGDVYEDIDGVIQSNYDSWYCETLLGETASSFAKRSIERARSYILEYRPEQNNKVYFVLVPQIYP